MNLPPHAHRVRQIWLAWTSLTLLALLVLGAAGCSMARLSPAQPKAKVNPGQLSGSPTGPVTPAVLQAQVMRFADTYVATVAQACDDLTAKTNRSAIRLAALRWKLGQATAIFTDATGPNASVNALDMLVLVSMARMVMEDYGVENYGDVARELLEAHRGLEAKAWQLAGGILKPSQQQELRDLILEWRSKNPHQRYIGPVRFQEFVTALGKAPTKSSSPGSIFSLLYLDPLAGLDPTAAAIQEIHDLGDRAMYYSQRMPMLLSWQVEVLAYQLAVQPESEGLLTDVDRLADAAEVFASTARQLPQLVNDQRQAAIQQVLDGLIAESNKSRELLGETRSTLAAVSSAAVNLNTTVQSLTEFVRYVSSTNDGPASALPEEPFHVADYGAAAAQIGVAAGNLNALLASAHQTAPEMAEWSRQTTAEAERVLDRVFWRGVALILILLVGLVLAALAYRALANHMNRPGR